MTIYKWQMTNDKWQVTSDKWQMKNDKWQMKNEKWQMTNDKWQVTEYSCSDDVAKERIIGLKLLLFVFNRSTFTCSSDH